MVFKNSSSVFSEITNKMITDDTLGLIITVEATIFGFLLAVLALVLQMDNKMMKLIKEYNRYNELIDYCKKAIYASFFVIVISIVVLLIKDTSVAELAKTVSNYLLSFFLIYSLFASLRFVKIFFILAKSN